MVLPSDTVAAGGEEFDSLLGSRQWGEPLTGVTVTFSFVQTFDEFEYAVPYGVTPRTFVPVADRLRSTVLEALAQWDQVSGIDFVEVDRSGDVRFASARLDGPAGFAYEPSVGPAGGDVWLDPRYGEQINVPLHEIGHAIGLVHPNGDPDSRDARDTIMAYPNQYEWKTIQHLDIDAVRWLYGEDGEVNAGNTAYRWSDYPRATVLDEGGFDKLKLRAFTDDVVLDLAPGGGASFDGREHLVLTRETTIETALTGSGDDIIVGNDADNVLKAGSGDDVLTGGLGDDHLYGQAGRDRLVGASGRDIQFGGSGHDVFVLEAPGESPAGASRRDIIEDFQKPGIALGDLIDLQAIDANAEAAGDQAFAWRGDAGVTGPGQLHVFDEDGSTIVGGNVGGSWADDFQIEIRDGPVLASAYTADDFVL